MRVLTAALIILMAGAAFYFYWTSDGPKSGQVSPAGTAQGAALYADHCAACHGVNLEGQPNWRTRLPNGRLPAPPHDETGHTWHHPDDMLFAVTKRGTEAMIGSNYKSDMRGFGDTLNDRQIWAVLDFIKSRWPEEIRQRQATINARQRR